MATQYHDAVLGNTPLAYWRFGEASGTTAVDSSGNLHHGTYTGGVTLGQAGALTDANPAADFDATAGTQMDPNAAWAPGTVTAFSVEAWIWIAAWNPSGGNTVVTLDAAGASYLYPSNTATTFALVCGGVQKTVSGAALTTGAWHHLVGTARTVAEARLRLYVDGAEVGIPVAVTAPIIIDRVCVGGYPNAAGFQFDGVLDEVALYAVELLSGQVASHYLAASYAYTVGTVLPATLVSAQKVHSLSARHPVYGVSARHPVYTLAVL